MSKKQHSDSESTPVMVSHAGTTFYRTEESQAQRILRKFGGARMLMRILRHLNRPKTPASIYRWTYPRERGGTGGIIPTSALPDVMMAARYEGVHITAEDLDPRPKISQIIKGVNDGKRVRFTNTELKQLTGDSIPKEENQRESPGVPAEPAFEGPGKWDIFE